MLAINTQNQPVGKKVRGGYEKFSTQPNLFFETKVDSLTDEQVKFRLDDQSLRGDLIDLTPEKIAQLAASSATQIIQSIASGDSDALEFAINGDLEGVLSETCINFDAMLDRCKALYPKEQPKTAFVKFCQHIVGNLNVGFNTVEFEKKRVMNRREGQQLAELNAIVEDYETAAEKRRQDRIARYRANLTAAKV
ncbi:MAG TPA: hypothetical protein PKY82_34820 [Pyrinomonadaceae bacterium]|nr:hypothetical protein [Pyrinomonadaceae bacterium]